ncbi:MAG: hypothetical protein BWY20_00875 [Spirochaetes bacterium ADurb.Bin215]|nr:MAG: hypothetical protein BWY20_00875 [Spirochaetes bacterium ADurb.Bin215]
MNRKIHAAPLLTAFTLRGNHKIRNQGIGYNGENRVGNREHEREEHSLRPGADRIQSGEY